MYGANLSWTLLQSELAILVNRGFLEEFDATDNKDDRTNILYGVTKKGLLLLRFLDSLYLFIEGKRAQINLPLPVLRLFFQSSIYGQEGMDRIFNALGRDEVSWLQPPPFEEIISVEQPQLSDDRKVIEAEYVVVDDIMDGWAKCPECHKRIGERSIIGHIKRTHGKKARIIVENNA